MEKCLSSRYQGMAVFVSPVVNILISNLLMPHSTRFKLWDCWRIIENYVEGSCGCLNYAIFPALTGVPDEIVGQHRFHANEYLSRHLSNTTLWYKPFKRVSESERKRNRDWIPQHFMVLTANRLIICSRFLLKLPVFQDTRYSLRWGSIPWERSDDLLSIQYMGKTGELRYAMKRKK
jgi:hypothetical protein